MKNLDLVSLGVEEICETQMILTDGGSLWGEIVKHIGIHLAYEFVTDVENWERLSKTIDAAGGPSGYMPLR